MSFLNDLKFYHSFNLNMLYLITASSHVFYALIWLFPRKYIQLTDLFNLNTLNFTKSICFLQKIIQISFLAMLKYNNLIPFLTNINTLNILFILIGQLLNAMVYYRLGSKGVYYGNRLGHPIKWLTLFPFNVLRHPQYIGSMMTFIGLYPLLDLTYIIYACSLYFMTMYIETY